MIGSFDLHWNCNDATHGTGSFLPSSWATSGIFVPRVARVRKWNSPMSDGIIWAVRGKLPEGKKMEIEITRHGERNKIELNWRKRDDWGGEFLEFPGGYLQAFFGTLFFVGEREIIFRIVIIVMIVIIEIGWLDFETREIKSIMHNRFTAENILIYQSFVEKINRPKNRYKRNEKFIYTTLYDPQTYFKSRNSVRVIVEI